VEQNISPKSSRKSVKSIRWVAAITDLSCRRLWSYDLGERKVYIM